jgi:hypothetical protein
MIGNSYAISIRDSWGLVPGHRIHLTNNAAGNPVRIDFYENGTILFYQVLTYDNNDKVTDIECLTPETE